MDARDMEVMEIVQMIELESRNFKNLKCYFDYVSDPEDIWSILASFYKVFDDLSYEQQVM